MNLRPLPLHGYFVSEDGRIWSTKSGATRQLATYPDSDGYAQVTLTVARRPRSHKRFRVSVLVCTAFHGVRPTGCEVRHLNGIRADNRSDNLCWGTARENFADRVRHGHGQAGEQNPNVRLSREQAAVVRQLYASGAVSQASIARSFGIGQSQVSRIVRGKNWVAA